MKPSKLLKGTLFVVAMTSSLALAQTPSVEFDLRLPSYDVIYLSDLVDIRNVGLSDNIPDMSIEMSTNPSGQTVRVYIKVQAQIQLRGDSQPETIVRGESNDFDLVGSRRLSSKDLSGGGAQGIRINTSFKMADNSPLRKKLEDYVQRFPTAPVGQYFFEIEVYDAAARTQKLGGVRKVITVRNASEQEIVITLVSPEQGAIVPSPFPTFSWSSEKPEVVLFVYEKLPIHRSAEEAVTGIPYLKRNLSGLSTFTYPADAERRLEIGKAYYWFVETKVLTSRGDLSRRSEIRLFRVLPGGGSSNPLLLALSTMGGDIATQLGNLIQDGWQPSGATIDGSPASVGDVNSLLQRLTREDIKVKVNIE